MTPEAGCTSRVKARARVTVCLKLILESELLHAAADRNTPVKSVFLQMTMFLHHFSFEGLVSPWR